MIGIIGMIVMIGIDFALMVTYWNGYFGLLYRVYRGVIITPPRGVPAGRTAAGRPPADLWLDLCLDLWAKH